MRSEYDATVSLQAALSAQKAAQGDFTKAKAQLIAKLEGVKKAAQEMAKAGIPLGVARAWLIF
jgi:hypothetical protein